MTSLCRPLPELSCFRCCPPIRPAGYDHLDHRAELTRQFRDNTARFRTGDLGAAIAGYSCWGLGFPDPGKGLVGCLLHPARNPEDLRSLTGYGAKCGRETCPQHQIYSRLDRQLCRILLEPVRRQDSFEFSSPRKNPLWTLLLWGEEVLSPVRSLLVPGSDLYSYLTRHPEPRSRAFFLAGMLKGLNQGEIERVLGEPGFAPAFEEAVQGVCRKLVDSLPDEPPDQPFIHRQGLDSSLADLIRLGLNRPRLSRAAAEELAARLDSALESLRSEFTPE